jgi:hypothetical protein
MKLLAIQKHLDEFLSNNLGWLRSVSVRWLDPIEGAWLDEQDAPLYECHGIYCLVAPEPEDDVLYVGKAHYAGVSGRVWSHVRTPDPARRESKDRRGIQIYPNHRWKDNARIPLESRELIRRGQFRVAAMAVSPRELSALFEGAALAWAWVNDGRLPVLNQTF